MKTWRWSDGITIHLSTAATDHSPKLYNARNTGSINLQSWCAPSLLHVVLLLNPSRHPSGVCDTFESGVWEPTINKRNSLRSATEAACLILSIDETVKNPQVRTLAVFDWPAHSATRTFSWKNVLHNQRTVPWPVSARYFLPKSKVKSHFIHATRRRTKSRPVCK